MHFTPNVIERLRSKGIGWATLRLEIGSLGDVLFCHATPRNDMAAAQSLAREMLTGAKPTTGEEPLEQTRTLPLWLTDWLRSRWTDAGRALAGMRPPPPSSSQSSQLFA